MVFTHYTFNFFEVKQILEFKLKFWHELNSFVDADHKFLLLHQGGWGIINCYKAADATDATDASFSISVSKICLYNYFIA